MFQQINSLGSKFEKLNKTVKELSLSHARVAELAEKSNFAVMQLDSQIIKGREKEVWKNL